MEQPGRGCLRSIFELAYHWTIHDGVIMVSLTRPSVSTRHARPAPHSPSRLFRLFEQATKFQTNTSFVIMLISVGYASLLHYMRTFDRRLAVALYTDSKTTVNPAERRGSTLTVGLLGGENGRRASLIPPNQAGYAAIETGAGRMGL